MKTFIQTNDLNGLNKALNSMEEVTEDIPNFQANLKWFGDFLYRIEGSMPTCAECGVRTDVHCLLSGPQYMCPQCFDKCFEHSLYIPS